MQNKNPALIRRSHHPAAAQEGDVNLSPHRRGWQARNLDDTTRRLLDEDAKYFLHQSLSTPCLDVLSGCDGIYLTDSQGRRFMDFHGNSVHQVGYGNPRVVEAIKRQLDELCFCPRRFTNAPAVALARKLAGLAPGTLDKVLFAPGGASAIGIALKLARYATGRFKTVSMWGSFHGASLDAISIGGEELFRRDLGPLLPGAEHVQPYTPGPDSESHEEQVWRARRAAQRIEEVLAQEGDVAAVIAEPMRCTTVAVPPVEYWRAVRESCDRHGALLVFDEIPVALGRTGHMFACEHFGVEPDILVVGKGLGGGIFPMAAVIANESLDVVHDKAIGHYTHEKSPVGAAAALATIQCLEEDGLLEHARALGVYALAQLRQMQLRHPLIHQVRGLGLLLGVELRSRVDRSRRDGRLAEDSASSADMAERLMYGCLERGLSFKVSDGNVLTLTPPLTITKLQLDEAFRVLEESIQEVENMEKKT